MPVIKWDLADDPLDVDKKKVKKKLAHEANSQRPGEQGQDLSRQITGQTDLQDQNLEVNPTLVMLELQQQLTSEGHGAKFQDNSFESQLIQIRAAEEILIEKLRQQNIANGIIEAATEQNEKLSVTNRNRQNSKMAAAEPATDHQSQISQSLYSNANIQDSYKLIENDQKEQMIVDKEIKSNQIYKQGIKSNNNKTFDIIKKNERIKQQLLNEQRESETLANLLIKQKAFNQQPTLVSAYPQRDLQQTSLESSHSPLKSPQRSVYSKRGTVVYATSKTHFDQILHENSPHQFQLIQNQQISNGQNTIDINKLGKAEVITDREGPQRRNYAEHMHNKNALRHFNHTQNPMIFSRKSSGITSFQTMLHDQSFAQRNSSFVIDQPILAHQDSSMFEMPVTKTETKVTPELSIDHNQNTGQAQVQTEDLNQPPFTNQAKLPIQIQKSPEFATQKTIEVKQVILEDEAPTLGPNSKNISPQQDFSGQLKMFSVADVRSPLSPSTNIFQFNSQEHQQHTQESNVIESPTQTDRFQNKTIKKVEEIDKIEEERTPSKNLNSSQVEQVSQTEYTDIKIESQLTNNKDPSPEIKIGGIDIKGSDLSPKQRRDTIQKLKDLEHAEKVDKVKNEQTKEALRMQKINKQIERTSSLKKKKSSQINVDEVAPTPKVNEKEDTNFVTEPPEFNVKHKFSPRRFETTREFGTKENMMTQGEEDSWIDKTLPFKKEESEQPKSPLLNLRKQETGEIRFENNLKNLGGKGFGHRFNQTQIISSPQSATLITNKNVLSKRALEALDRTQQMFPSRFHTGQKQSKKSVVSRQDSQRTSLSRLSDGTSKRKIGGIARRRIARQSTRIIAQIKKTMSKDGSLQGDSSISPVNLRKSGLSNQKKELQQDDEVVSIQIGFEKEQEQQIDDELEPLAGKESPLIANKKGVEQQIQAKLSLEEKEQAQKLAEQEKQRKMLGQRDEYGAIAVQTSSQTLPNIGSDDGKEKSKPKRQSLNERSNRDVKPHPTKAGMTNAGQQLEFGQADNPMATVDSQDGKNDKEILYKDQANEPKERDAGTDARVRDTATDPMVGEKDTDPRVRDGATDAWKRDGEQQTMKPGSHQESFNDQQKKQSKKLSNPIKIQEDPKEQKDSHTSAKKQESTVSKMSKQESRAASRAASISRNKDSRNQSRITKMINERIKSEKGDENIEPTQKSSTAGENKRTTAEQKTNERQDSRSTQMMFENQFKKRKKSNVASKSKDKGKLVYLPNINKPNDAAGGESITRDEESQITKQKTKRESSKLANTIDASNNIKNNHSNLNSDIFNQIEGKQIERHHPDKSKCTICIRKRAEREARRQARDQERQEKLQLQSQTNSQPQQQMGGDQHFSKSSLQQNQYQYDQRQVNQPNNQPYYNNQQQPPYPIMNGSLSPGQAPPPIYNYQNNQMINQQKGPVQQMGMMPQQQQYYNNIQRGQQSGFQQNQYPQQQYQTFPNNQGFQQNQQLNYNYSNSNMFNQQNPNQMSNSAMPQILNNENSIQKINQNQQSLERLPVRPQPQLPMINVNGATGYDPMDSNLEISKPIYKFFQNDKGQKSQPLKYFKGQDLEMHYMEKQLKPEVEKEIKEGFFEIKKKFNEEGFDGNNWQPGKHEGDEVQVYVSHLCLHNFHPIFCKFTLETVKIILNYSSIVYLNKGQTLYAEGFNDQFLYVILFGRVRVIDPNTNQRKGQTLNIGWTVGEEILFKGENEQGIISRTDICRASTDGCVLGIEKKNLLNIKKVLQDSGASEEFMKLEVVLRGNHLVKKDWN